MKRVRMGLVLIVLVSAVVTQAYARDCANDKKGYHRSLEEKFLNKVHFFLGNQDGLGLSDRQMVKIRILELKTRKVLIRKDAELDLIELDIKDRLRDNTVDTVAIDKMIDHKFEIKKARAKSLVSAYAALKRLLTDEQKEKMKSLWKKCGIKMTHGSAMEKKMMSPMQGKS
jgi:hypothetical protein